MIAWLWKWSWRLRSWFGKKGTEVGATVPDFTLSDVSGMPHRLSTYLTKKNILLWMTNLCDGCQERLPLLEELSREFPDSFQPIAISVLGGDLETPKKVQGTHRPSFPLLVDPEDWVEKKLGLPHDAGACPFFNFLLLSRSGRVVFRGHLSAVKPDVLRRHLVSLS